jgi:FkbM family methyltransferase
MFVDESGRSIEITKNEKTVQSLVSILVLANSKVLELGSKYGSVTCKIAESIGSGGVVVAVEPNSAIWETLEKNLASNKCEAKVIRGNISKSIHRVAGHVSEAAESSSASESEKSFTLQDALTLGNVSSFDTLVANSDVCIESFILDNTEFLNGLHTILFSANPKEACNNENVKLILKGWGFKPIFEGTHNAWIKNRTVSKNALWKMRKLGGLRSGDIFVILLSLLLVFLVVLGVFYARNADKTSFRD